jgi:DNA-binding winged helix-turn-helix (wHTH) protein
MRLRFGEFELDTIARRFWRGAVELVVEPKVFDCLALLISEAGQLVRTEVVRAALWPGVHVGDGALRRIINEARKALGDTAGAKTMIHTKRGLGYVFVPEVTRTSEHRLTPAASGWPFVGRDRELGKLRVARRAVFRERRSRRRQEQLTRTLRC